LSSRARFTQSAALKLLAANRQSRIAQQSLHAGVMWRQAIRRGPERMAMCGIVRVQHN
jgi:hypothetical protein